MGSTTLMEAREVAGINDRLRSTGKMGMIVTRGVKEMGTLDAIRVMEVVREFSSYFPFDEDNDPQGYHEFGSFSIGGTGVFWKIDCYEKDSRLSVGTDQRDPEAARVLTVMLASEY